MYEQEKIIPYNGKGDKGKLVEEMFDKIAPTYDTLNHRLSWDIDKGWRKKAIKKLQPYNPQLVPYTHFRATETRHNFVCRLLLKKKKETK